MSAIQYIVVRIKDCPVRGTVHVIESMPLPLVAAQQAMLAEQMLRPEDQFICEMLTDAEIAELA